MPDTAIKLNSAIVVKALTTIRSAEVMATKKKICKICMKFHDKKEPC